MATLDLKACIQAIKEREAAEAAAQKQARKVGEAIAQSVLNQLPQVLRQGQAVRITPNNLPERCSSAEKLEALLILKTATDVMWGTDWDGDKVVFCAPRDNNVTALQKRADVYAQRSDAEHALREHSDAQAAQPTASRSRRAPRQRPRC